MKLTNHEKEKRRRVYVQQQERLHHYVNQARDLGEFLRAVGHQIIFDDWIQTRIVLSVIDYSQWTVQYYTIEQTLYFMNLCLPVPIERV